MSIFIVVGLPCGHVYGFFNPSKLLIKFSTSCLLKSIPAFTAALHATVATNLSSMSLENFSRLLAFHLIHLRIRGFCPLYILGLVFRLFLLYYLQKILYQTLYF